MHIGEVLNRVFDERVGWRLTSRSVKPVHVANGLVRALQGAHYPTRRLNELVVWTKKGAELEDRSLEALLAGPSTPALEAFRGDPKGFERLRRFARGMLNADGAVFPSAESSSYSLTCGRMATRDQNDHGLGAALAELIRRTDLDDTLRDRLDAEVPRDPVSALAWPMLDLPNEGGALSEGAARRRLHGRARGVRQELREAARCLASHEAAQGNGLRTLQRAVHFGAAAAFAYIHGAAGHVPVDQRPPALVVMSERKRSDLARASERSLEQVLESVERWLGDELGALIEAGEPLAEGERPLTASDDARTVRRIFKRIDRKRRTPATEDDVKQRMQAWREVKLLLPDASPAQLLGQALVLIQRREQAGRPRDFVIALSRRAGLLYPPFQGRAQRKRLKPSVLMLDALVRSCVPAGALLPLDAFLERLWRRFGLLVGGRRGAEWDDAQALSLHEIHVDPQDLAVNTEHFVDELVSMGLARRFPDDVAFVGDGYDR